MVNEVLTLEEAAELLRLPRSTMYKLIAGGEGPPSRKIGKHRRFLRKDVLEWLEDDQGGSREA